MVIIAKTVDLDIKPFRTECHGHVVSVILLSHYIARVYTELFRWLNLKRIPNSNESYMFPLAFVLYLFSYISLDHILSHLFS